MEIFLNIVMWISLACTIIALPVMIWQLVIGAMGLFRVKKQPKREDKFHRFAVLICARNEEAVIGQLIDSLHKQEYPQDGFDIFVVADNCTDRTADVARECGARVYEREDKSRVGKGFALQWFFEKLEADCPDSYDAVAMFDADNLADPGFLRASNEALCSGADVTQGYRDSKNAGDSWVSGCYTLYWLGLMRFFHCARYNWGLPCQVGGTGFTFKFAAIRETGWNTCTLTEDGEFSVQQILAGHRIVPVREAVFYDEQPVTFSMSIRQRYRWVVGAMQCCRHYLGDALRGVKRGSLAALDVAAYLILLPLLAILTVTGAAGSLAMAIYPVTMAWGVWMFLASLAGGCLSMMGLALLIALMENRPASECWKAVLLFPLFMLPMAYMALAALVHPTTEWKPIAHTKNCTIADIAKR